MNPCSLPLLCFLLGPEPMATHITTLGEQLQPRFRVLLAVATATDGTAAAVGQSLRGQLRLHCCAPLSLAFLSELKPRRCISSFCFQPDYSFTACSSPVMTPRMVRYLPDSLLGPQREIFTNTQTNNYNLLRVSDAVAQTPFNPPK